MHLALVSTYESGHQPLHVATAAAALRADGHTVATIDLAGEGRVGDLDTDPPIDGVAFSVPMHTALRLAGQAAVYLAATRPRMTIAAYGLYAAAADPETFERRIAGEYVADLVGWARSVDHGEPITGLTVSRERSVLPVPDRSGLEGLGGYARLELGEEQRLVASVQATRGCLHMCRHCPLPAVYNGRMLATPIDTVLADISRAVDLGAAHISFGDPDFFNGPRHAIRVVAAMHDQWPELTYDATIKVDHIIDQAGLLSDLVDTGCLFVVSAFETLDDDILAILDKGHTSRQAAESVHLCHEAGLEIRPTWLPFTPWTVLDHILEMFSFIAHHDLAATTDPVQMSVRLLVPATSLLADHPAFVPHRLDYDQTALGYRWSSPDPSLDHLAVELADMAEKGAGEAPIAVFASMWRRVLEVAGRDPDLVDAIPLGSTHARPRLTEPWFC